MEDLYTLETKFSAELRAALLRAAKGRSPTLFCLYEKRARSSARSLRAKAERILDLRQLDTEVSAKQSIAARYLAACLKWEHTHGSEPRAVLTIARSLLDELDACVI